MKGLLFFDDANGESRFYIAEEITDVLTDEEKEEIKSGQMGTLPDIYKRMEADERTR